MESRIPLVGVVVGVLLVTVACGDSPTSPSPRPLKPSVTISGQTVLNGPGDTTQLSAILHASDGTTEDVTTKATWRMSHGEGLAAVAAPGLLLALRYGTGGVEVSYAGASASEGLRVAPEGAFLVSGLVTTLGWAALADSSVAVSSQAGTYRAQTDETGAFWLPAAGDATVRVERAGYRTFEQTLSVRDDTQLGIELLSVELGGLTGVYTLTFTASPSCALPPDAMRRIYHVAIEDSSGALVAKGLDPELVAGFGILAGFTGRRTGDAVTFSIWSTYLEGYNLIERIPSVGDLWYSGTAIGTAREGNIAATFAGTLRLEPALQPQFASTCTAGDHRMELVRNP